MPYRLSFKYLVGYSPVYKANITVAYSTQPVSTATSAGLLALTNLQGVSGNTTFTSQYADFIPSASGTYYISFRDNNQAELYIDNISVETAPGCIEPASLASSNISPNGATIAWDIPLAPPTNGYEYYLSTGSTAPVAATTATGTVITGTAVSLTGLSADTTYYIWVRSVCSPSDKSAWSASHSFFTGYCSATANSAGDYISAFATMGAAQNINYTQSTAPAGTYNNQAALAIQQYQGSGISFSTTYVGGGNGVNIWIDWNNDLVFNETTEKVFTLANSAATKAGTINIPAGTAAGSYRMRVRAQYGSSTNPAACGSISFGYTVDFTLNVLPCFTWTGTSNSNWSNTANWCGGFVPAGSSNVVIAAGANQPIISAGTAYANSVTINTGATLTVKTGTTLKVQDAITNQGSLVIENNAAVWQINNTANTGNGTATLTRNSNLLYKLDYTLWGAPVAAQKLKDFSPATISSRFYTYAYNWSTATTPAGYREQYWAENYENNFVAGKGYLIRMPDAITSEQATAQGITTTGYGGTQSAYAFPGVFTGTLNNGDVSLPIMAFTNLNGGSSLSQAGHFIAVANPYPSPISVQEFFAQNSCVLKDGFGMYFWRKKNSAASATGSYGYLTLLGYVANDENDFGDVGNNGQFYNGPTSTTAVQDWIVSPGQGFLVRIKEPADLTDCPDPAVRFTNGMRKPAPATGGQPFFKTLNNGELPATSRLWLNLTNANNEFSQAMVGYMQEATPGLDYGLDGRMLSDGNIKMYSKAADAALAIQARPQFEDTDVVPLGFSITVAGQYTITLDHTDGLFSTGRNVYLKDNLLGSITNLSTTPYLFTTDSGTFDTRFEILYLAGEALGTQMPELDNTVIVYQQNGSIIINSPLAEITDVRLFDIRGRKLYEKNNINATETSIAGLSIAKEVIIVEISTPTGRVSKKIVY